MGTHNPTKRELLKLQVMKNLREHEVLRREQTKLFRFLQSLGWKMTPADEKKTVVDVAIEYLKGEREKVV